MNVRDKLFLRHSEILTMRVCILKPVRERMDHHMSKKVIAVNAGPNSDRTILDGTFVITEDGMKLLNTKTSLFRLCILA